MTDEGEILTPKLVQRRTGSRSRPIDLRLDLEELSSGPAKWDGMDNTEAWCDYARGALERSCPSRAPWSPADFRPTPKKISRTSSATLERAIAHRAGASKKMSTGAQVKVRSLPALGQ